MTDSPRGTAAETATTLLLCGARLTDGRTVDVRLSGPRIEAVGTAGSLTADATRACVPRLDLTGYLLLDDDGAAPSVAQHAWMEGWIAELGWVGFDAANNLCPTDRYVRLTVGLDAASAAPIRGIRRGAGAERLEVAVAVRLSDQ